MKTSVKQRTENVEGVVLDSRTTLAALLREKKIYDLDAAAAITGLCVRYLRRLCHQRKVDHHKLLGRYYMTPAEVAALMSPVKKLAQTK